MFFTQNGLFKQQSGFASSKNARQHFLTRSFAR
jgi:hypothetical protein